MVSRLKNILSQKASRIILIVLAGIVVFSIVLDQWIMPLIVHSRATITMPNVIGMPQEHAVELLERHGLKVQDIRQQYDSVLPAGRVVLQMPYPNATVREGRRVYLVVSRGDEVITVPSLYGMTLRQAQLAILQEGLQLGKIQFASCDSIAEEAIIGQNPPAGTSVRIGTPIHLTLCRDTSQSIEVPNLLYRSVSDAQQILLQYNLQLGEVTHQHDETFTPGTVLRQDPPAGMRVPPLTPIHLWVASNL